MEFIIGAVISLIGGLLWWARGLTNNRIKEAEQEVEYVAEVTEKNAEADNSGSGSDLDARVRNKFKNRR